MTLKSGSTKERSRLAVHVSLLDRLREGEATVSELTEATGATQQNVSKHLGVLLGAAIVSRRKEGTSAVYAIADDSVLELCENVCGGLQRQFADLAKLVGGTLR